MTTVFTFLGVAAGLIASVVGVVAGLKRLVMSTTRVNKLTAKQLLEAVNSPSIKTWRLQADFTLENEHPESLAMLAKIPGVGLVRITWSHRLLTAGNEGKESICVITHSRFASKAVWRYLEDIELQRLSSTKIPVDLLQKWTQRLGFVRPEVDEPRQPKETWGPVDADVADVVAGRRERTGMVIHGEPGTGKSSFVRYLAIKYRLPIKIVILSPEMNSVEVLVALSGLPSKCIILFEDFDAVFHGRKPQFGGGSCKFTFDALLNAIDGVHSRKSGQVWVMTANDLSKVDVALTDRPGRFRHILYMGPVDGKTADQYYNAPTT